MKNQDNINKLQHINSDALDKNVGHELEKLKKLII